jgi:hypothetical protein
VHAWHPDSVYEQSSAGRRFGPALIAVLVVLAAAAGTLGYFGTRAMLTASGSPGTGSTTSGGPQSNPNPTATTPTTPGSPTTPPSTTRTTVPPGDPTTCPVATKLAVHNAGLDDNLSVLLYIQTHKSGLTDSEVWICQNLAGLLIYQGHILNGPLDAADNEVNTILLATGIKGSVTMNPDEYVAVNPNGTTSTEYHVTKDKLTTYTGASHKKTEYPVIKSYP